MEVVGKALKDKRLNKMQRETVEKALMERNKLLLMQGPPGKK